MAEIKRNYDIIIIGTGLVESILAGGLTRAGKTVLHLEIENNYGSHFSAQNYNEFVKGKEIGYANIPNSDQESINLHQECSKNSRNFSIERIAKLVFSSGPIVDLLVKSKAGSTTEFQLVKEINLVSDKITKAPTSKEDVFNNTDLDLIEKRKLMKFLSSCMEYSAFDTVQGTFWEFATESLPESLALIVTTSIACIFTVHELRTIPASYGILLIQRFLKSMGKYGNGAFLSANYGTGSELSQVFCRYAAVFGAVYILDASITGIVFNNEIQVNLKEEGVFTSDNLIIAPHLAHLLCGNAFISKQTLTHCVCISKHPFGENHAIFFKSANLKDGNDGICGIQYVSENQVCPEGFYLLHLWTTKIDYNTLIEYAKSINKEYFMHICYDTEFCNVEQFPDKRVMITPPPSIFLDAEESVQQSKEIFEIFLPEHEFYPFSELVAEE